MIEAIETFLKDTVGPELCVLICSMLPIIECRGAVPLGLVLELPWWKTAIFAVIGNLIPVPLILVCIKAILNWMVKSKIKFIRKFGEWLYRKVDKHKGTIEKYSYVGVAIFVGIPIPGTGAWTGSLIASVLKLNSKKSFLAAVIGVLCATTIMVILCYGLQMAFS